MGYTRAYLEKNREIINQKRRDKYNSDVRKEEYRANREDILAKSKTDRAECPHCGMSFRRLYIPQHIARRHNNLPNQCKSISSNT
jgi:hypothetical protein